MIEGDCIEWQGRRNDAGYGMISMGNKQFFAHRLAVALSGRNIPKSKVCDHLCRNRACINPDHIELVTAAENTLRGEGPSARYARSGTCHNGHEFTVENTRIHTDAKGRKTRHCRHCYADRKFINLRKTGRKLKPSPRRKYE